MELLVIYNQTISNPKSTAANGEVVRRRTLANTLAQFMERTAAKGLQVEVLDAYPVTDSEAERHRGNMTEEAAAYLSQKNDKKVK